MTNEQRVEILKRIRKSICDSDAVVCVVWMHDSVSETVVEAIDGLMLDLGMTEDELEYLLEE